MSCAIAEKFCPKCGTSKPSDQFYGNRQRKDGLYGYCKPCTLVQNNAWRHRNPEAIRAIRRRGNTKNPVRGHVNQIKYEYGLTREDYERLYSSQNGQCAIAACRVPLRSRLDVVSDLGDRSRVACVDHDHTTGKVRALLCSKCNYVVGCVEKYRAVVECAKEYLRAHSC